jgi:hypothetical protein
VIPLQEISNHLGALSLREAVFRELEEQLNGRLRY